jgi:hypothetical protein
MDPKCIIGITIYLSLVYSSRLTTVTYPPASSITDNISAVNRTKKHVPLPLTAWAFGQTNFIFHLKVK